VKEIKVGIMTKKTRVRTRNKSERTNDQEWNKIIVNLQTWSKEKTNASNTKTKSDIIKIKRQESLSE
jgi:hypothetical protein